MIRIGIIALLGFPFYRIAYRYWLYATAPKDSYAQTRNQVNMLCVAGKFKEALPIAQQWLVKNEKLFGSESTNVAASLDCLASVHCDMGEYAKAEQFCQRSLKICEKVLGPEHINTVMAVNNLGVLYYSMGESEKAEPLFQRSLLIIEKVHGPKDPNTAMALLNLAGIYKGKKQYAKAEELLQRCLEINQKAFGPNNFYTAMAVGNLGALYQSMGDYSKAEPLFKKGLKISEKALGPDSLSNADFLESLGMIYQEMGEYAKAKPMAERALKICEKALGPEHPKTAIAMNNLGLVYDNMGNYTMAEELLQRCLKITEKAKGPEHPDTVAALKNLGDCFLNEDKFTNAMPLFELHLKIAEKQFGQDHTNTANALLCMANGCERAGNYSNAEIFANRGLKIMETTAGPEALNTAMALHILGEIYQGMGEYAKAEPLLTRVLNIKEKTTGINSEDTGIALANLALFYRIMGDCVKAEPLYDRALKIFEKELGPENPNTAEMLFNIAQLNMDMGAVEKYEQYINRAIKYYEKPEEPDHPKSVNALYRQAEVNILMGRYEKAEELLQRCLKITEKAKGPDHPDTADAIAGLARIYNLMGDYEKAEQLCQRSLKILEKTHGPVHPDITGAIEHIAFLQIDLKQMDLSVINARKATAARERNLGSILSFTSERQRMAYQATESPYALLGTLGCAPELAEVLLRNKGVVLNSVLEDQLAAQASKDPAIRNSIDQLHLAGRRLTQLQLAVPKKMSEAGLTHREMQRETLENEIDIMQKRLARNVSDFNQTRRVFQVTVPQVQAVLPKDGILMDFVRYEHYLGKGKFEKRYGAVLVGELMAGFENAKVGEPAWVPLGSAETIENELKRCSTAMHSGRTDDVTILHSLYAELFDPIQKRLPKGIATLIISPDAELNFLSFATLLDDRGKFLAERYTIKYVASGRDLLSPTPAKKEPHRMVAFANPTFWEKPALVGVHGTNIVHLAILSADQMNYSGMSLNPLPNTIQEAEFLREKCLAWNIDGVVYVDDEATEAQIKSLHSPYILHIATHGFFLPETLPANPSTTSMKLLGWKQIPIVLHNPMQRSGLAFAGAQLTLDAWKRGETPDTENDGILMAQEVSMMDLQNTWLVVLSGCDTGVGEARAGEGVLGLRRGFIQAGAQNLMMTLWPVSDSWTVEMMKAFYERAMKTKDAPGALASVQREFLQKLKQEKNPIIAARLAGPFVMTFQGNPINN